MYSFFDIVMFGSLFLIVFILIDFIRNKTTNLIKRIICYSFIFYLLNVAQITTGGIVIPPQQDILPRFQFLPFYFIGDLYRHYLMKGFDWSFWNSFKLSFYNLIMLVPFGIYLPLLFKQRGTIIAVFIVFLLSLSIETGQVVFGYMGFVHGRGFDVDDLILNTLGGSIGYISIQFCIKTFTKIKGNRKGKEVNILT